MDQDTLLRLKDAALRQFNLTAPDGTCREGVALLTKCDMIFSGHSNNADSPSALESALELHNAHIGGLLKDGFEIVALAIAVDNTACHLRGETQDQILYAEHICTDATQLVIDKGGETCQQMNLADVMPS